MMACADMASSHQHVLVLLLCLLISTHTAEAQPNYNLYAGGAGCVAWLSNRDGIQMICT